MQSAEKHMALGPAVVAGIVVAANVALVLLTSCGHRVALDTDYEYRKTTTITLETGKRGEAGILACRKSESAGNRTATDHTGTGTGNGQKKN